MLYFVVRHSLVLYLGVRHSIVWSISFRLRESEKQRYSPRTSTKLLVCQDHRFQPSLAKSIREFAGGDQALRSFVILTDIISWTRGRSGSQRTRVRNFEWHISWNHLGVRFFNRGSRYRGRKVWKKEKWMIISFRRFYFNMVWPLIYSKF